MPPVLQEADWEVTGLHWNLTNTLLAVGLLRTGSGGDGQGAVGGVVQVYYRGNYHWYLKQQWTEEELTCLGWDGELVGRLYLSHKSRASTSQHAIRIVDLTFDVCVSSSNDCSVAVTDGNSLLITPLATHTIPPPMSLFTIPLPHPPRYVSFFDTAIEGEGEEVGVAALCCGDDGKRNIVSLSFLNCKGKAAADRRLSRQVNIDIATELSSEIEEGEDKGVIIPRAVLVTRKEGGKESEAEDFFMVTLLANFSVSSVSGQATRSLDCLLFLLVQVVVVEGDKAGGGGLVGGVHAHIRRSEKRVFFEGPVSRIAHWYPRPLHREIPGAGAGEGEGAGAGAGEKGPGEGEKGGGEGEKGGGGGVVGVGGERRSRGAVAVGVSQASSFEVMRVDAFNTYTQEGAQVEQGDEEEGFLSLPEPCVQMAVAYTNTHTHTQTAAHAIVIGLSARNRCVCEF